MKMKLLVLHTDNNNSNNNKNQQLITNNLNSNIHKLLNPKTVQWLLRLNLHILKPLSLWFKRNLKLQKQYKFLNLWNQKKSKNQFKKLS
jgi:hypothetical protein